MSRLSFSVGLRRSAGKERLQAFLEDAAVQENATFAGKTADADVRAKSNDFPIVPPAGVWLPQANNVA